MNILGNSIANHNNTFGTWKLWNLGECEVTRSLRLRPDSLLDKEVVTVRILFMDEIDLLAIIEC